ncbi:DedA family protein [Enterovibrio calviensis]|uniref:DedA family protein n=1 Tax=Enterovibrio calviensis TaxID=91359 RepID=UPI0005556D63|nr:DedA family protein [Enterovibrio calviensis]
METILGIIRDYGLLSYVILFLYCGLKSGSLPLFAGIAAHFGAMNIALVSVVVFAGGYLGDELRFFLGRKYGVAKLNRNPRIRQSVHTAKLLLERYGKAYIFLYRYPKGMRTIGALPVALNDMRWATFTSLNFASAITWTFALVGTGYLFGTTLENTVGDNWGLFSVGLLAAFSLVTYLAWRRVAAITRETRPVHEHLHPLQQSRG